MGDSETIGKSSQAARYWRMSLYAALVALIVFAPFTLYPGGDVLAILYIYLAVPFIGLLVLISMAILRRRTQRLSLLAMFASYLVITVILFLNYGQIRFHLRWWLWSNHFKAELRTAPNPTDREFKHVELDGWGFAGMDTVEYLVFDPTDSLYSATKNSASGKFKGIPCEVPQVRHLENHYYAVVFYSGWDWEHCG